MYACMHQCIAPRHIEIDRSVESTKRDFLKDDTVMKKNDERKRRAKQKDKHEKSETWCFQNFTEFLYAWSRFSNDEIKKWKILYAFYDIWLKEWKKKIVRNMHELIKSL